MTAPTATPRSPAAAMAAAVTELLSDPAEARAGARHARDTLTWDASAAAHLALYRELV